MSFMVILVAKLEYNAYQAGIEDVFNAQAGTTFLQDCCLAAPSQERICLTVIGSGAVCRGFTLCLLGLQA